jgi:localization factor PodJL
MTRHYHLSLDRLDRETREVAREAARQAGMTLDEWVASLIAERSGSPLQAASKLDADIDAVREKLAGRPRQGKRDIDELIAAASAESERRDREAAEKTAAALDSVARWIERAESRLDETARVTSEHHERTSTILGEALEVMTRRLDDIEVKVAEGQQPAMTAALKAVEAVDRLEQQIAIAAAERDQAQNAHIERALQGFEDRIAQIAQQVADNQPRPIARRGVDPADVVRSAVADIRSRQSELERASALSPRSRRVEMDRSGSRSQADILMSLKSDIADLAEQLGSLQSVGSGPAHLAVLRDEIVRVQDAMGSLATRDEVGALEQAMRDLGRQVSEARAPADVAEISQPIAAMQGEIARLAGSVEQDGPDRFAREIDALERKLDATAQTGVDGDVVAAMRNQLAQLSSQLSDLAEPRRIEKLATEVADLGRQVRDLAGRQLDAITDKLDTLIERGPAADLDGVTRELERLSNRMEGALLANGGSEPMEPILDRLDRLSESLRNPSSDTTLKPLEDMLRSLTDQLGQADRPGAGSESLDAVEKQIAALSSQLDRASGGDPALANLERTMNDLMAEVGSIRAGTPEIGALQREVADLKARQGASDQRMQETLAGLGTMIENLAGRLGVPAGREQNAQHLAAAESLDAAIRNARASDAGAGERAAAPMPREEVLLEPGSERPRLPATPSAQRTEAETGDVRANFIAAARRAAQAAASEAASTKRGGTSSAVAVGSTLEPGATLVARVRSSIDRRRRPILYALAAIVLALGAMELGKDLLSSPQETRTASTPAQVGSAPTVAAPAKPDVAAPTTTGEATPARVGTPAPAPDPALTPGTSGALGSERDEKTAAPTPTATPAQQVSTAPIVEPTVTASAAAPNPALGRIANMAAMGSEIPVSAPGGLRQAALAGDPAAVYDLATRAAEGRGIPRDLKLAAKLFEKAAAQGLAPAQYRIGGHYEKGLGVARDLGLAKSWYQRAAEKGNARAMHNLAVLLAEAGANGRPDYAEAATWFRRAAELGVRDSQFNLGVLLARGLGVQQNLAESYTWFSVAAGQGDEDAAKKRDEVGGRLAPADLASAKTRAEGWRAQTPSQASNEVALPAAGWGEAAPAKRPASGRV